MNIPIDVAPKGHTLVAVYFLINSGSTHLRQLSEMGELEVEASSQHAFMKDGQSVDPGIQFLAAFHGEHPETRDTVRVALKAIGHPKIEVLQRGGFEIGQLANGDDQIKRTKDILRLTMTAMLGQYTGKTVGDAPVPTFLVGYPAPHISFAANNMNELGHIGPADIVVYYVSRGPDGAYHFHAVHWPNPLKD